MIEAAARAGDRETAATAYQTLSRRTWPPGRPGRSACAPAARRCSTGTATEDAYRESISQLARSRVTIDLARTHLLYGQWLRRAKRRRDARQELRTAQDMFVAMGATASPKSRLRAAGDGRARPARTPETT